MVNMTDEKNTIQRQIRACKLPLKVREAEVSDDKEFYSEGFIMTTHPDRANEDGYANTMFSYECLESARDAINNSIIPLDTVGSSRTVSNGHDWVKNNDPNMMPAGMAMPPAEIRELEDGHYGLWAKTHHNKNHPDFNDIKYDVQHGYIPGYSIEFIEGSSREVNIGGKVMKLITSFKDFLGYAFATARMIAQPKATIESFGYREVKQALNDQKEVVNMSDEQQEKPVEAPIESPVEEPAQEEVVQETPEEEVIEEPEETVSEEKTEEPKEEPQSREVKVDNIIEKVIKSRQFNDAISNIKPEPKVRVQTGEDNMNVNIRTMQDSLSKIGSMREAKTSDEGVVSYREAALGFMEEQAAAGQDIFSAALRDASNYNVGFKHNLKCRVSGKGVRITGNVNVRGTLDNGSNPSSYTQAPVEFADVFQPGIIDTFNNQINLFGFLKKEQHLGGRTVDWKMITNKDPESNGTFVGQNDTTVRKNYSNKLNYQTPLKIARRGVSVTDFINEYSAASLGDLFMREVDIQMTKMMKDVNAALFAEVADGTGNSPLGLEAVADSAGNTTLYGYTRSTANRLAPDTASDTYVAVGGALTESALRAKVSYLETEGVSFGDIAIVASPTTRDYLFNLLDGNRRFNTTEASFGFNKANVPSYDGTPIIVDSDCNSDAIYIIDTMSDVIVMAKAPTMIDLAKVGAATEAYIQMDFAHVYKQPRRIGMLDTLSGPTA